MKPASLAAIVVFSVVAVAHLLRVVMGVDLSVAGRVVPMGVSIAATVIAGGLAVALWRERRAD